MSGPIKVKPKSNKFILDGALLSELLQDPKYDSDPKYMDHVDAFNKCISAGSGFIFNTDTIAKQALEARRNPTEKLKKIINTKKPARAAALIKKMRTNPTYINRRILNTVNSILDAGSDIKFKKINSSEFEKMEEKDWSTLFCLKRTDNKTLYDVCQKNLNNIMDLQAIIKNFDDISTLERNFSVDENIRPEELFRPLAFRSKYFIISDPYIYTSDSGDLRHSLNKKKGRKDVLLSPDDRPFGVDVGSNSVNKYQLIKLATRLLYYFYWIDSIVKKSPKGYFPDIYIIGDPSRYRPYNESTKELPAKVSKQALSIGETLEWEEGLYEKVAYTMKQQAEYMVKAKELFIQSIKDLLIELEELNTKRKDKIGLENFDLLIKYLTSEKVHFLYTNMKKKKIIRKDLKKHGHKAVHDSTIMNEVGFMTWTLRKDGIKKEEHVEYSKSGKTIYKINKGKTILASDLWFVKKPLGTPNRYWKKAWLQAKAEHIPINFNVDDYYLSDPNIYTYNIYSKRHKDSSFLKMYKNRFSAIEELISESYSEENI